MRHALVPVHLIQQARGAAAGPPLAPGDAAPDEPQARPARPRRFAAMARRARALVARTT